jgi:hypothetical protein
VNLLASSLPVRRRLLPWLVAAPFMVGGSMAAHGLAYRVAVPSDGERADLLATTGHGYLRHTTLLLSVLAAVAVVALGSRFVSRIRGRLGASAPFGAFFVLPLLGFSIQEHAERWLANGSFPVDAALEPTFLVGLVLQLPFAGAVVALVWALLGSVDRVAEIVRTSQAPRTRKLPPPLTTPAAIGLPRPTQLALGHAGRAPPPRF